MPDSITLYELNEQIKDVINNSFRETYWIVAEISELRVNTYSGHCYLELVEKNKKNEKLKAKAKATIWAYTYRMLKPYFETTTGRTLSDGLKVMVKVIVEFHEIYSLSLNILDIDPSYTLGDLALKKQEIIKRLEKEGVIDMNKELEIPEVTQKIAIISSKTAAGYDDFLNQLLNNEFQYAFYTKLFSSAMQGDKAEESIINALDKIYKYENFFDVVVIIRGGGSKLDLSCFDSYWLSYNITQFPIPIITGIGHERDDTIVDIVANTKLKTPTAAAEFFIKKLNRFEATLMELKDEVIENVNTIISYQNMQLSNTLLNFQSATVSNLAVNKNKLEYYLQKSKSDIKIYFNNNIQTLSKKAQQLKSTWLKQWYKNEHIIELFKSKTHQLVKSILVKNTNKLELAINTIELVDPKNILKKGYSLTFLTGKLVKSIKHVKKYDEIETHLSDGIIKSDVN